MIWVSLNKKQLNYEYVFILYLILKRKALPMIDTPLFYAYSFNE